MDRSTIKRETLESLVPDVTTHDSAATDWMVSAPCCSEELKQKGLMNNSVKLGMNGEIQNGKMENYPNEPSSRIISNLVVIAPQDEDFVKCEQYEMNRRPYSPDHKEDLNQYNTIPAVKHKMMDIFIKEEIKEEIDVEQVGGKIQNREEYARLEQNINCLWVETVKKEEQPVVMKNEMSEDRPQKDLVKSERIDRDFSDEQTSKLSFSGTDCRRSFRPRTAFSSSDEESTNYESCTLSSCEESDKKEMKVCGSKKSFTQAAIFHNHMTHHNVELFSCPDCDKAFPQESLLKTHLLEHTSERPHLCTICNKCFAFRQSLQRHKRTHAEEQPYRCTTCDKCFTTLYHLQRHQRTHTGEKPYACTTCEKSLTTQYHLLRHQRTHTGEKPYACTTCVKSFRDQSALKAHQRSHTGEKPYGCTMCDKSYTTQRAIKAHQRTHTGEKLYACTI